jgi:hypothetical protein
MLTYTNGVVKAGVMISNGQTTNADDSTNNKKDVAARVEFTPPELRSVTAGGFANMADWGLSFRTRYGFNLRHNWRDWIFRGEYIHALDSTDVGRPVTHSDAFIFDAGYMILSDRLQGVARFDTFASNATSFESARAYNLGLNYFLKGHNAKVQVWASRLHNFLGSYGSYTITGPGLANAPSPGTWLGVVALQVAI